MGLDQRLQLVQLGDRLVSRLDQALDSGGPAAELVFCMRAVSYYIDGKYTEARLALSELDGTAKTDSA